MPSRIPSSLTPSSSTSSSASSSFVPYSAFTAASTRDPLSLHNTATAATLGLPDLSQFAALRDTRSQSLGSSLSSSRDEYEHLSYTPIYPSYSSSFSNSSLEFHESLLLAIRERQLQLNRMRADSSTTTNTTTTTTSALLASNIAGDFHTAAPRPSTTVSEALEQEQLRQQQDMPTGESLPPIPDTLHSDTPVTLTDTSTLQDATQPSLELALNPPELDPSFHDSFPAGGPQDDRSQSIDSLTTSLMRSRAFSDLGPPFQPLLAREAPLIHDTHHHPPNTTTTTTTTTTNTQPAAAPPPPPRGLARRRYTTRDYSSGPLSTNDWLRHPDVVSFSSLSTATPSEPVNRDNHSQETSHPDTTHENQENIPPPLPPPGTSHSTLPDFNMGFPPPAVSPTITPRIHQSLSLSSDQTEEQAPSEDQLAQDHDNVIRMFETLGVAPAPPLATMDTMDHTTPQPLVNIDQDRGPPPVGLRAVRADEPTLQRPPTSSLETNHPDRLGLLGPLLSGTSEPTATTTATTTTTPSTEPLDFSLLESSRPGLNSTILSMASRIRQARIARLLRLVGERDSTVGYRERYAWNRMAHADTRSMVNHASGSRGTSRADSLEDGLADLGLEGDSQETAEDTRSTFRNRDVPPPPSHFHPANGPSFAEILDCNGNPIDWSNSNSYASSSASSSIPSLDTTEDGDEDLAGWGHATSTDQRRRRRGHTTERHHGTVGGHRRPRILTTGTAFEGMEHISEADSMLLSNDNYRSLKGSWLTNPNGECWSDDEEENPLPSRRATDTDDKDQEVILNRRGQPSLGVLQPSLQHQQGSNTTNSLYYIYGNVRNRYGPEVNNSRRQRVLSEMTDLLQREQEWERELDQYNRAMLRRGQQQLAEMEEALAGMSSSSSSSMPSLSTATTGSGEAAESSSTAQVVMDTRQQQQQQAVGSTTNAAAPHQNGMLPGSEEGFMEYEQGHSQYHTQNVGLQGHRFNRSLGLDRAQPQAPLLDQTLSFPRQPSSAPMNRTPPLLPTQPRENEPIPHQIRRAHTSHMVNLQRRWEQQQQLMQSQRLPPSHGAGGGGGGGGTLNSADGDQDMTQRYPITTTTTNTTAITTTFVPPPSQQELRGHTYSSQMVGGGPMAPLSSLMAPPVPMSRGNRSSFRTSHETSGFQNFLLSGIVPPLPQPTTATTTTTTTGATTRDPLVGSSSSSATSATLPAAAAAAVPRASSTFTDSIPLAAAAAGTEATSDDPNMDPNQYYWRTQTIGGSSSLYTDYEGGTLKPEERWRRGKKEMVGR